MDKIYGWAFVILPDKEVWLKTSQAIVGGSQKNNILLESHVMSPLDTSSPHISSELRKQVSSFARDIVELNWPWRKITITSGVANSIDASSMIWGFASKSLRKIIPWDTKMYIREFDWIGTKLKLKWACNESIEDTIKRASRDISFKVLWDLFQKWTPVSKRLKVDRRAYNSADERDMLGLWKDMRLILSEYGIWMELIDETYSLLVEMIWEKTEPTERIRELVRELATKYAEANIPHLQQRQVWWDHVQRFVSIDNNMDIRNIIFVNDELRNIFSETFLKVAWFKHNICLKPHWAKPSPPFGDVVATFLADEMDIRDWTSPTSVGIFHWEDYT